MPGPTSFPAEPLQTAPASVPDPLEPCLNCGHALDGPYCSRCGQRAVDLDVGLRALLRDTLDATFGLNGRLARTLRPLLTRPGELTAAYLSGQRIRYTSPVRLYLVASLLFFATYSLAGDVLRSYQALYATPASSLDAEPSATRPSSPATVDGAGFVERVTRGATVSRAEPARFTAEHARQYPRMLLVALPLLGFALGLVYRRQRRPLIHHLIFALHFGAVALLGFFVLMTLGVCIKTWVLAEAVGGGDLGGWRHLNLWLYLPLTAALTGYLYGALRRVYAERLRTTLGKLLVLAGFAILMTLLAGIVSSLIVYYTLGG